MDPFHFPISSSSSLLSKGSRRRVLRESAGARSHVDANPEAHAAYTSEFLNLMLSTIDIGSRSTSTRAS